MFDFLGPKMPRQCFDAAVYRDDLKWKKSGERPARQKRALLKTFYLTCGAD